MLRTKARPIQQFPKEMYKVEKHQCSIMLIIKNSEKDSKERQ
tara:strand:+ start:668 stop:793 length:126 start_codon:yes stop_codon:yes gene_type:complete